jgi:hypothetical protein
MSASPDRNRLPNGRLTRLTPCVVMFSAKLPACTVIGYIVFGALTLAALRRAGFFSYLAEKK